MKGENQVCKNCEHFVEFDGCRNAYLLLGRTVSDNQKVCGGYIAKREKEADHVRTRRENI